jgi:antitoxin ParD1/3/4
MNTMSKMGQLSGETAEIVQRKVDQGLYADAESAVAEAVRLLDEYDREEALLAKFQVGIDELERGEGIPWNEEAKQRILREGRAAYERGDSPDPDVCP